MRQLIKLLPWFISLSLLWFLNHQRVWKKINVIHKNSRFYFRLKKHTFYRHAPTITINVIWQERSLLVVIKIPPITTLFNQKIVFVSLSKLLLSRSTGFTQRQNALLRKKYSKLVLKPMKNFFKSSESSLLSSLIYFLRSWSTRTPQKLAPFEKRNTIN